MRKLSLIFTLIAYHCLAQVGIGTLQPHPSAVLDIQSDNKGILIPRVELHSTNDPRIGDTIQMQQKPIQPTTNEKVKSVSNTKKKKKSSHKSKKQRT